MLHFFETVESTRVPSCFKKRSRLAKRNNCAFITAEQQAHGGHKSAMGRVCPLLAYFANTGARNRRSNASLKPPLAKPLDILPMDISPWAYPENIVCRTSVS